MEYIELNNGVQMPMLGLGTVQLKGEAGVQIIKKAIEVGYRLIDTAKMYHNEDIVGQAIAESGIDRNELFITTKLCRSSNSYEQAVRDIEDSLKQLQVDYVDLLLVHEPYVESYDMYEALKEAYISGKARAIGISNFNQKCYREFIKTCGIIPAVNQMESHVYFTQRELQLDLEVHGTKMQAWSPLANGKKHLLSEPILVELATQYNKTPAQIALRYLIQNGVSAIPRTSNEARLKENINLFDFTLSAEEVEKIRILDELQSITDWYRDDWF